MNRLLLGALVLSLAVLAPMCAPGRVDVGVGVGVGLPHVVLSGPPDLIVIPGTYVYVIPDLDVDVYFYDGWWWSQSDGSWYRSRSYDSGWMVYRSVPSFYRTIPPGWRHYYSDRNWEGYNWNVQRIPQGQVSTNWKTWKSQKHWEKQNNWWVEGYNPKTRRPQEQKPEERPGRGRGRNK